MTLRSGWVPAGVVLLVGALLAIEVAQVTVADVARFLGYLVGWIVLPGTLAWRALGHNRPARPLGEDLAIGALVGYVLEFPVYLGTLAIGHPHVYVLWPVAAVAGSLLLPQRRAIWLRTGPRLAPAWSWSVSGGALYVLAWFAQQVWAKSPATTDGLTHAYVDEPFHLALATGLRHFFPPRITYVDDTSLQYHWLSHLHIAASSWASGVEPAVLLHSLSVPALTVACCVALAFIASRLTQAAWPGPVAMGGLLIAPAMFTNWSDGVGERFLVDRLVNSPSAAFVNAALLLGILLIVELLRGSRIGVGQWLLLALVMLAMIGAKSTSLPTVLGGLAAAGIVALSVNRDRLRVVVMIGALGAVMFVLGMRLFFGGGGSHGLTIDPFALTSEGQTLGRASAGLAALSYLGFLSTAAGMIVWLRAGGWREPDRGFLIGLSASGFGAGLLFHQEGLSEYYFVYVVFLPMLLGGVLGLHHAISASGRRAGEAARVLGGTAAIAVVFGLILIAVDRTAGPRGAGVDDLDHVLTAYVAPVMVVALIVCAAAAAGVLLTTRRPGGGRGLRGAAMVAAVAGVGLAPTVAHATTLGTTTPVLASTPGPALFPAAGVEAARWLRAHSAVDDLVATNAHCQQAGQVPGPDPAAMPDCTTRNFWMAAYAERQFLVEGWSYVTRSDDPEVNGKPLSTVIRPYWDPAVLTANDAAFTHPTAESLRGLRTRGVRWLFVDRRDPVDMAALRALVRPAHRDGEFVLFRLPD